MMLFQTQQHDIVYTGDFRTSRKSIERILCLQNLNNVVAYVDSTFLKKNYMHFPSQAESVEVILSEIDKYLKSSSNSKGKKNHFKTVHFKTSASFTFQSRSSSLLELDMNISSWKSTSALTRKSSSENQQIWATIGYPNSVDA